ncbi:MAG: oligosaccharide flippase family protein, partial [Bacteroidales bacterium]|nr:oligosaccharide flippase family protein [Bacteroidales bacterium]
MSEQMNATDALADPQPQSLKRKTAKGLLWGGINSGLMQVFNFAFGIILANLLLPAEYGLVALLGIFSSFASILQEGGFISALNQKEEATSADYNAVFWFSSLMGLGLYLLGFFCA